MGHFLVKRPSSMALWLLSRVSQFYLPLLICLDSFDHSFPPFNLNPGSLLDLFILGSFIGKVLYKYM